jgi:mono/diheme cytochrome c family protein
MTSDKVVALALTALVLTCAAAAAQQGQAFAPEQIRKGAGIFAQNCSPCHGARMADPQAAFDLRKFPRDEKDRFVDSVSKGKNAMPPWGDLLQSDDIDALWAYVMAGEKQ